MLRLLYCRFHFQWQLLQVGALLQNLIIPKEYRSNGGLTTLENGTLDYGNPIPSLLSVLGVDQKG